MEYLAKKSFSFLQDCAFTSINNKSYTNKRNILQKNPFLFCTIVHLLVLIVKHILINGTYILQKSRFLFCKILHLLVYDIYILCVFFLDLCNFNFHW